MAHLLPARSSARAIFERPAIVLHVDQKFPDRERAWKEPNSAGRDESAQFRGVVGAFCSARKCCSKVAAIFQCYATRLMAHTADRRRRRRSVARLWRSSRSRDVPANSDGARPRGTARRRSPERFAHEPRKQSTSTAQAYRRRIASCSLISGQLSAALVVVGDRARCAGEWPALGQSLPAVSQVHAPSRTRNSPRTPTKWSRAHERAR